MDSGAKECVLDSINAECLMSVCACCDQLLSSEEASGKIVVCEESVPRALALVTSCRNTRVMNRHSDDKSLDLFEVEYYWV
jgi:hypothetical protein